MELKSYNESLVSDYLSEPHNALELEDAVIGAMLLEVKIISEVIQILSKDSFHNPNNSVLFEAISDMWSQGDKVDLLTVSNFLSKRGQLTQLGGTAHLAQLTQKVGSGAHTIHHAQIIQERYMAREFAKASIRMVGITTDKSCDIGNIIEQCNEIMDGINSLCAGKSSARHIGIIAIDALKEAEHRKERFQKGEMVGISTGITELDKKLHGLQPLLYILAARPSMGKTAMMIHFAKTAALSGKFVCLYSLEMSDISLVNRFILSISDVDSERFKSGNLGSEDWRKLEQARVELAKMNIYIDSNPTVTMDYVAAHSQMMKNQGKCDMIMLDYLQFVDSPNKRFGNRNEEVGKMSKRAKQISKNLNIPFILLSQLSRDCEKRTDKHPLLSDLRDSGNIEQDADVIMFLYRDAYYGITETPTLTQGSVSTHGLLEVIVAKQRDGATGVVPVTHNPEMTKFSDYGAEAPIFNNDSFARGIEDDIPF